MNASDALSAEEYQVILRNDLTSFIERSFYELNPQAIFLPGRYIELIASALERCRIGKTKRLIINLPPRSLKSHAASVAFPAWQLGHDASKQIICASYGQDLADKHARDCRTLTSSSFYRELFPGTVLSPDKQSVNDFMTTSQGFRMATSVNGVLTGRGADIIILDDLLKPDDALSEPRRRAANDWYFNTLLSRLNSKDMPVRLKVIQKYEEDNHQRGGYEFYFDLIDYPKIAAYNWALFQPILGYGSSGGKEKQLSWLNFINLRRNIVNHASSGKTLSIDELNQLEQYEQWLNRKIGELAGGTGDTAAPTESE